MKPYAHESPMQLGEDEPVKMTMKTLVLIIGGAFTLAAVGVRWELKLQAMQDLSVTHTAQLVTIQVNQSDTHEHLLKVEFAQREQAKILNYIANGRRGDPPPKADDGNSH